MTNDTSKLDGALMELGDTMADNLVAMGVSGASASDGLTTLANKITDIAPSVGGITPVVTIDISKTPSSTIYEGDTVLITCKVNADYDDESVTDIDLHGYLQGATLTIKNSNTTLGTCVSDSTGVATYTISNIATGSYSITAHFDGTGTDYESATSTALTFTVDPNPYLLIDDCSTDNTSDYTYISTRNSSTATLTFNSNGYYEYTLTRSSSEGFIAFPLTGVSSTDTIQIEYDTYKEDGTSNTFGNIGGLTVYEDDNNWATQKGNSPPDNNYYWGKKTNGSFSEGSANHSFPSAQTWVHVTATLTGTSLSIVFDVNGTTYSRTLTVNSRSSNTKFGIPISWICTYPNTVRLKNIVVRKISE